MGLLVLRAVVCPREGQGHPAAAVEVGRLQDQGGDQSFVGGRSRQESAQHEDRFWADRRDRQRKETSLLLLTVALNELNKLTIERRADRTSGQSKEKSLFAINGFVIWTIGSNDFLFLTVLSFELED